MRLDNDAIGRLGHNYCIDLCDRAGLVPNPSIVDKTGWDVLAEFKDTLLEVPTTAATLHEGAPQCRIQVKTTTKNSRVARVALTNLHRMATDPLPAFVLIVRLDKKAEHSIKGVDLVHLDHSLIRSVLGQVHEESSRGEAGRPLNKIKMSMRGDQGIALKPGDAQAFRQTLLTSIESSFGKYVLEKRRFVEETGYENGYGVVSMTLNAEPDQVSLTDLMLGKVSRIPVEHAVAVTERFGRPDPLPYFEDRGGYLEMPGLMPEPATMIFRSSPLGPPIASAVRIYHTAFGPEVADEHHAIRIVGPFFELESCAASGSRSMKPIAIDLDQPMSLKDLSAGVRLLNEWTKPEARRAAILRRGNGLPELELTFEGEFTGMPPPAEVLEAVRCAVRIVGVFESSPITDVRLRELAASKNQLRILDMMLSSETSSLRLNLGTDVIEARDKEKPLAVICLAGVSIAGSLYAVVLLVTDDVVVEAEGTVALYTSTHRVLERMVLKPTLEEVSKLESELERIAEPFRFNYDVHFQRFL